MKRNCRRSSPRSATNPENTSVRQHHRNLPTPHTTTPSQCCTSDLKGLSGQRCVGFGLFRREMAVIDMAEMLGEVVIVSVVGVVIDGEGLARGWLVRGQGGGVRGEGVGCGGEGAGCEPGRAWWVAELAHEERV